MTLSTAREKKKRAKDYTATDKLEHMVRSFVSLGNHRTCQCSSLRTGRNTSICVSTSLPHNQATKELGRELKKVKAFLLQRLVKKCRKLKEKQAAKEGRNEKERYELIRRHASSCDGN